MPSDGEQKPKLIRFIDEAGTVVGYALLGMPRPDVGSLFGYEGKLSGYQGYMLNSTMRNMTLQAENSSGAICSMKANL